MRKNKHKHLIGTKHYDLEILDYKYINGYMRFYVKCVCGTLKWIRDSSIVHKKQIVKSCGCRRSVYLKEYFLKAVKEREVKEGISKPQKRLLRAYKGSAKRRKLAFELPQEYFFKLVQENCFYCNLPPSNEIFHHHAYKDKKRYDSYIYSGIDRKNPKEGYTVDNCVPCCRRCNFAKRDETKEEFIKRITTIYNHLKNKDFIE